MIGGVLSDRGARRKVYVVVATAVMAVAAVILVFARTMPMAMAAVPPRSTAAATPCDYLSATTRR